MASESALSQCAVVRTEEAVRQLHRSAQEAVGHRLRSACLELLLSSSYQTSRWDYSRIGSAEGAGADGASFLQPVCAGRRGSPGSRQERVLHGPQALPHGAGAEAIRLYAQLAV